MVLPFDEIITLGKKQIPKDYFEEEHSPKEIEDTVEELLVMSYALGWGLLDRELGTATQIDQKAVLEALESKIEGKQYKEYLAPHIEEQDIEGVYRVLDTEVHRMYNTGQYDNATKNGCTYKTWRTMEDLKVRDTHVFLDKVKVKLDEKFYTTDGDSAMYPSGFGLASNNVNCRCILSYSKD